MKFCEMFGDAKFVTPSDKNCISPYILGKFMANGAESALITVTGLGMFELYINGKKVSDDIHVPAHSMYEKRENAHTNYPTYDVFSYRVYVLQYDLLPYLIDGVNSVCLHVGPGWYCVPGNHAEGSDAFSDIVKACFKIEYEDKNGTHIYNSDENLKWKQSFVLKSDFFFGEVQDYTLYEENISSSDYDISELCNVSVCDAPEAEYYIQTCPKDKIHRSIKPTLVKDFGNIKVYDNGENISGVVKMRCTKKGERVVMYHTEEINEDCTLNPDSFCGANRPQKFEAISDGKTYMMPHFHWHGFRYFSVEGEAAPVETLVMHADVDVTCDFECDNEVLNWLFKTYVKTQLANMHMGIPSDCPHREKLGYTGDGQLCCDAVMTMFDAKEFYRKWIGDIADSQDTVTGHVSHTAPFNGGGGGPGGWGCAMVEVPYQFYKHYGDVEILEQYFPNMLHYIDYMDSRCFSGFITSEEGGWCLGDWGFCDPVHKTNIPESYVNTYFYIKSLDEVAEVARILGKNILADKCEEKARTSRNALKAAFMSPHTGDFAANLAGSNAFAIDLGIADERTIESNRHKYSERPCIDMGIFALDVMIKVLFEMGDGDLAFEILSSREPRLSFGYMMEMGATTLWEYMSAAQSHNHPMFGPCTKYLFTDILGIKQKEGSVGYEKIEIRPCDIKNMSKCSGYITTPKGKVSVSYVTQNGKKVYTVSVPDGVEAEFIKKDLCVKLQGSENVIEA